VGHTLLLRGVGLDVDDISNSVVSEVGGHVGGSMLCPISHVPLFLFPRNVRLTLVVPREHVTRSRP
jgi:hypothetical protein